MNANALAAANRYKDTVRGNKRRCVRTTRPAAYDQPATEMKIVPRCKTMADENFAAAY
jgi:hypothetical protein